MKKLLIFETATMLFIAVLALSPPTTTEVAAPETNNYTLVSYDGHMHTVFSDGDGTVSDVVAKAKSRGLNALIITDHGEDLTIDEWNWLKGNCSLFTDETFLCLPGFEITGNESVLMRDHIVVYNASNPFVTDELAAGEVWPSPFNPDGTGVLSHENMTKWVEFAHSQGGITIHAHPTGHTKLMYGVDLIEIWNQNFIDEIDVISDPFQIPGAGYIMNNLAIYGERDLTEYLRETIYLATSKLISPYVGLWIGSPEDPLNSWDSFLLNYTTGLQDYVPFAVGNTDSHNTGSPESRVGIAKTGVYATSFSAEALYEGIRNGRSFVTTGPIISFNVSGAMMGETLFLTGDTSPMLNIKVESSAPPASISRVDVIKNGTLWKTFSPNQASFEAQIEEVNATLDSYYRVEVVEYDPVLDETHFAYSNPIFVKLQKLVGDINLDGVVDIFDVVTVSIAFGSSPGEPNWNQAADVNRDDFVDIFDVVTVATNFGKTA